MKLELIEFIFRFWAKNTMIRLKLGTHLTISVIRLLGL